MILITDSLTPSSQHGRGTAVADNTLSTMRQSIVDGAPDTASGLARQALASGMAPIDAINGGLFPACMTQANGSPEDKCFCLT